MTASESRYGLSISGLICDASPNLEERRKFMIASSAAPEGGGRTAIPVGLDVFVPVAEAWNLSTDEQMRLLGSPPSSTFFNWKKDGGARTEGRRLGKDGVGTGKV